LHVGHADRAAELSAARASIGTTNPNMKTLNMLLLFCAMSSPALFASDPIEPPRDVYPEKLAKFSDTAEQELRTIRGQLDAATAEAPQTVKFRYAEVYTQLNRCEALLGEVKIADPLDVNARKTEYEKVRAQLLNLLKVVRGQ
jgi:hypothetical protein